MMFRTLFCCVLAGCAASLAGAADLRLMAGMDGASVVSATESKGVGQAMATLTEDGDATVDIAFSGLAAEATAVELLMGKPTENGTVIAPLDVGAGETAASRTGMRVTLTPEQEQAMRDGLTYVVVRTIDFPAGAIRGQLVPQGPVLLDSAASGAAIKPVEEDRTNSSTEPTTDR